MSQHKTLPLRINAPLKVIRDKLESRGIISKSNKPIAVTRFITQSDNIIVSWFCRVGQKLLNYYRCCNNFYKVTNYVDYFIRWSAIHTLAAKHGMSCKKVLNKWSRDLVISDSEGFILASFPNKYDIRSKDRKFLTNKEHNAGLYILDTV